MLATILLSIPLIIIGVIKLLIGQLAYFEGFAAGYNRLKYIYIILDYFLGMMMPIGT